MLSHVYVGVTDFDRALAFYGPLMEILGYPLKFADRKKAWAAWNPAVSNRPLFLIGLPYNGERAEAGNGQMIALLATSRQSVDRCYHAALAQGGQSEGAPGLRPRYHTDYYGAYFRDLDGNKLCVCCHEPVDKMAHIPAENIDQVLIRHAEAGDLDDLLEIYNYYVRETAITFDIEPRTAEQREMWLNDFSTKGRYQCFVAVTDDKTIGWASSHRYNERAAYETTVSTSVYLAPHKRVRVWGGCFTQHYLMLFRQRIFTACLLESPYRMRHQSDCTGRLALRLSVSIEKLAASLTAIGTLPLI